MLYKFQSKCIGEMKVNLLMLGKTKFVVNSPTGSGKTIMTIKFIEDIKDQLEDTLFLWFAPGTGFLHRQSFEKMKSFSNVDCEVIESGVNIPKFESGKVYFANWEKFNKSTNVSQLDDGDHVTFQTSIDQAKESGKKIFLIVDEEHLAQGKKTMEVISQISPDAILRLSATPKTEDTDYHVINIDQNEVRETGMIRGKTIVNDYLEKGDIFDDTKAIEYALKKQNELKSSYTSQGFENTPLILIQMSSGNKSEQKFVEELLSEKGINQENGLLSIWLSDEKVNLNEIDNSRVLLFKSAVAVGWDYTRAQILVKLRATTSKTFYLQTLGRIKRNFKDVKFTDDSLNHAYLFTIDNKLVDEVVTSGDGKEVVYSELKKEFKGLDFPKTVKKSIIRDDIKSILFSYAKEYFIETDFVTKALKLSRINDLETIKGYIDTINNNQFLNKIDISREANNDTLKRIYWRLMTNDAIKNKMTYADYTSLLRMLFREGPNSIANLKTKDYYYFSINNHKTICDAFMMKTKNDVLSVQSNTESAKLDLVLKNAVDKEYSLATKGLYSNYPIEKMDSNAERMLVNWLETNVNIKGWVKNDTSISSPFNVVYNVTGELHNFKPDFMIVTSKNDSIIIEVKGESDIDKVTKFKYEAAHQQYKGSKVKFIIVRPRGNDLVYLDESTYSGDLNKYKKLEDLINE